MSEIYSKQFRNVTVRVSAINNINKENKKLGVKAGDIVKYSEMDIHKILRDWAETKQLDYFMITHNRNEENEHFHIVIKFGKNSQCTYSLLKQKFPYGFIKGCEKRVRACVQYLVHKNNPEKEQYDWSDIITNAPGWLEEYKNPSKYGLRRRCDDLIEQIIAGKIREYEIGKIAPEIYLTYKRRIENAFEYNYKLHMNNPIRNISVFVLQGKAGTGKTTFCRAWAEQHNQSICLSSGSNDPWQDYKGQDIFVLDDCSEENIFIEDMIKSIDNYFNTTIKSRYKNKTFIGSIIIICTNKDILSWFLEKDEEVRSAFFRRINYVLDFHNKGNNNVTNYTLNKLAYDVTDRYYADVSLEKNGRCIERKWVLQKIKDYEFDLNEYILINDRKKEETFLKDLEEISVKEYTKVF